MSYDREKYLLAFGRAMHISAKETDSLERAGRTYTYKPGPYTIGDNVCECKEYVRNTFMAAHEAQGQVVANYPGVTCKHVLTVALLEGTVKVEDLYVEDADKLSAEDQGLLQAGFADQTRMVKERDNPIPTGEIKGRKMQARVSVLRVTAEKGYIIDLGNKRTVTSWAFGFNGLDQDEAVAKAKERFGEGFVVAVETGGEEWAGRIDPIA